MNLLQDDKGNWSSLRALLLFVCVLIVWMYIDWRRVLFVEMLKETPDYGGVVQLFSVMLVTFGLAFAAKLIQKKFEK